MEQPKSRVASVASQQVVRADGRPVPDVLEDLLRRCLAKRADRRPKDMREFLDGLSALDLGEDTEWDDPRCIAWWA